MTGASIEAAMFTKQDLASFLELTTAEVVERVVLSLDVQIWLTRISYLQNNSIEGYKIITSLIFQL